MAGKLKTPLEDLADAQTAYEEKFGQPIGYCMGADESFQAVTIWNAVATGVPIPDDFDWYPNLPDGALT